MNTASIADLFVARLDAAEARLSRLADHPLPEGLSDPDPGGEERWDAPRVWAHLAEFPAYWTGEVSKILAGAPGEPVPFGRARTDPGRVDPIERDRLLPVDVLWTRVRSGIDGTRTLALSLAPADWDRLGQHPARGVLAVGAILAFFVADHLEEHATQLERLAAGN